MFSYTKNIDATFTAMYHRLCIRMYINYHLYFEKIITTYDILRHLHDIIT